MKRILSRMNANGSIGQFAKYLLVGGLAAIGDISLYLSLTVFLGVNHIAANSLSFTFGLFANYFMSREWVFNHYQHRFGRDFAMFAAIGVLGLGISNIILYLMIDLGILVRMLFFAAEDVTKLVAKLIAVFTVLFWNFVARKKLVFHTA